MTQKAQILEVCLAGPATSLEVASVTGLPMKHCSAYLRELWREGVLTRSPFHRDKLPPMFLYSAVDGEGKSGA